jgi:hypothetical protein
VIKGRAIALDPSTATGLHLARCVENQPDVIVYRLERVADAAQGDPMRAGVAGVNAWRTLTERSDGLQMLLAGILQPARSNQTCIALDQQRLDDLAGVTREKPTARPGRTRADDLDEVFEGFRRRSEREVIDAEAFTMIGMESDDE